MTALRAPLKLAGVLGLLWALLLLGLVPQSLLDRESARSLVYSVRVSSMLNAAVRARLNAFWSSGRAMLYHPSSRRCEPYQTRCP